MAAKADLMATNTLGQMPAHIAVMRGSFDILQSLKDNHMPLDRPDRFGRTPLDIACMQRWPLVGLLSLKTKRPSLVFYLPNPWLNLTAEPGG